MRNLKIIFGEIVIILTMLLLMIGCIKNTLPKGTINGENIDFYTYSSGSSSLSEELAIYKYKEKFIFVARYFNCGDEIIETYALTKDQEEKFIESLNGCTPGNIQSKDSVGAGGSVTNSGISVDGEYYPIKELSMGSIGVEVKDVYDIDFQENTFIDNDLFETKEINNIIKHSSSSEMIPICFGSQGFERVIYDQIGKEVGDDITRISVLKENENDFTMQVFTENGKKYKVTATYMGYVSDIE